METQEVFSIKNAAGRVGLCERFFRQQVLDGKVTVVKIGSRKLITRAALDDYLERHTIPAFDAQREAEKILTNENSRRGRQKTQAKRFTAGVGS